MKTTVEITDALFEQARAVADEEKTTFRALVEEGLRKVLAERAEAPPFKLEDGSFKGEGYQPGMENASWAQIRDLIYEGRGT